MRPAWPLIAFVGLASLARADEPPARLQVVVFKDDAVNIVGMNARGDVVGFELTEQKAHPGVLSEAPFLLQGKTVTYLPLLKGYTATFPAAVSDDGLVVGRAGKPGARFERVMLRNQAIVWDAKNGIRGLGTMEGDWSSFANGVSRDGKRISGYCVGDNRIRPCVWDRDGGNGWKGTVLPHEGRLGLTTVPISGNGKLIAAIDGAVPCLWSCDESGRWSREVIGGGGSLIPRGINDSGTVVGLRYGNEGLPHAAVWTREKGVELIAEPKGYVKSEANAVNNRGLVVGMVDGPAASKVGPNAFAYRDGKLRILNEGGPNFGGANAVNDSDQVAGAMEVPENE
jgi:uncharacterized membrane protein